MAERRRVLVLHGPNLNLLGFREVDIYGASTLAAVDEMITKRANELQMEVRILQSNHEGALIDAIHEHREWASGIVINPGGLAHTSVALRDAIAAVRIPCIEVHITNIFAREGFRHTSIVAGACQGVISGLGVAGYLLALEGVSALIEAQL
jgi:3-dehydroquinate dehydratase-2